MPAEVKYPGRCNARLALQGGLVLAGGLAFTGCAGGHLQAGPMLGYSPARGMTWGWEAGAGGLGLVRASTGGSYRAKLDPDPEPPERAIADPDAGSEPQIKAAPPADYVHYLALEPIGVSLGADYSSTGKLGFMAGLWAGWVVDLNPEGAFGPNPSGPFRPDIDCPDYDPEPALLFSAALGLRYLGGEWEVYLTPKAVLFYCFEYAS